MTTIAPERPAPKPVRSGRQTSAELPTIRAFLIAPGMTVPVSWGWGISRPELSLAVRLGMAGPLGHGAPAGPPGRPGGSDTGLIAKRPKWTEPA